MAWREWSPRMEPVAIAKADAATRLLQIPGDRLRAWLEAGLIQPAQTHHGIAYFDFRQVTGAKTLCDLVRAGVTVKRLRRSL